mmetsp:Transcript_21335/g.15602  ORF Transcript_21335/g.15602 Transcript_21335/m.15602 type:complete len:110 (-) Transcript_21335:354-683(-)|eukprot:CAMPEP_0202962592 /NCGR_PEP_ID=MMETSP1396-20130829/6704_1 /ASSEMBLY_ACC=CAM_ASM_000872 /TAXON_ID= /ORGANISM="Pseudokeronopsis sp., Strain Brazil" /LENGTH=109 /DNA_ID=CAMNT_0049683297 /DNA_START=66 /DNA_END=395 /DNA_ORIENTATION=-
MQLDESDRNELMNFDTLNKRDIDFDKVKLSDVGSKVEYRRVPVPGHRYTPLKQNWDSILKTLVEHMKLQVRMNPKRRCVEIRTSKSTEDVGAIQKGADFLKAFMLGFEL